MIRTRLKKVFRDIWSRKGRTALVSSSIFIGVLGVITLTSVSEIMISKLQNDLQEDEIGMLTAFLEPKEANTMIDDIEVINALRPYPNLTAIEGRKFGRIFWKDPNDENFIESDIRAFSSPMDVLKISPVRMVEGQFPVEGQNQVVIERRMAERYGLGVGDEITIRMLNRLDATGTIPEETWTISGVVFHPYVFNGASSVYATYADMTEISGVENYTVLQARFTDFATAENEEVNFEAWIEAQTPYQVNEIALENPAESELISEVSQWTDTLNILALVSMLVASFLVVTVINTILVEQKRQIGVMKSIGATQPDNFSIYSGVAFAYGLLGTIPGVLLGIPLGYLLTKQIAPLANILIEEFTIAPTAIVIGAVMGLGVPVLAAAFPVYWGTRVSILNAMTDLGLSSNYGRGITARLINRLPFSPAVRQALANISQKQGRLFLTGLTLTLAVGAFMGVTAVFLSLNNIIGEIYETYNFEIRIYPDEKQDFEALSALILENVEDVNAVSPAHYATLMILDVPADSIDVTDTDAVTEHSLTLRVEGFDTESSALQLDSVERWDAMGVVLATRTAEALNKEVGDSITVVEDGTVYELEVIGLVGLPFQRFGFMRWQDLAQIVDRADSPLPTSMLIELKDENASAADVDKVIGEVRELLLRNGITADFDNQIAFQEEDNNTILTVGLVFNIASIVMAAIGAIGLLVSLSISVYERQREIGVMRSVGARTRTIITQFLTEGLLVGVLAWLIGVPLSYAISQVFQDALPIDFEFRYPPVSLLLGFIGMLAVAFTASIWPSVMASRKTVSDILRYQ